MNSKMIARLMILVGAFGLSGCTAVGEYVSEFADAAGYMAGTLIGAETLDEEDTQSAGSRGVITGRASSSGTRGTNSAPGSGRTTSSAGASPGSSDRHVNECVEWDRKSNSLADFVINRCSTDIYVAWRDQGACRTGCGDGFIGAGRRSSVTKTKGAVEFGACARPLIPVPNGRTFRCQ